MLAEEQNFNVYRYLRNTIYRRLSIRSQPTFP